MTRPQWSGRLAATITFAAILGMLGSQALAEKIKLRNGIVYQGAVDKDNTIIWIFDGLKRIVVRDSKIEKIEADSTFGHWEVFKLVQPLIQHSGVMPKEAYDIETTPWNDRGRRTFSYKSARSERPNRMEQAIYELGPFMVKFRGVDGFWQEGRLNTLQVPREVVLGLLAKVDRKNQNERRRVASFLIQAKWYPEAKREIDALIRDFPEEPGLRDSMRNALAAVAQLEATDLFAEIAVRRRAQQYHWVATKLKTFPSKDVSAETLVAVREQLRQDDAQAAADKALADALRTLTGKLPSDVQKAWKAPLFEALKALAEAPDAVRERFVAWQKAKEEPSITDEAQFALAMSGYVAGSDAAVNDLAIASKYWEARASLQTYLATVDVEPRAESLEKLEGLTLSDDPAQTLPTRKLDLLTRLVVRMPPPLHDDDDAKPAKPKIYHVHDDQNAIPTEYTVLLPPEYHPLRSYPAVVGLYGGDDPDNAIAWWRDEALRRGYIVIAPRYREPDQKDYTYSASEHAVVELSLRDARRRFAIDSNRVFLGGQLQGGDMAWDFGLAHPDLFAGVAIVSGRPFKYPFRYLSHAKKLPLYVAIGDLAPAGSEIVFTGVMKPLISKTYDATFVEYYRRGLEDLPEEAPFIFDWMDRRKRDPYPDAFEGSTARDSDNRFYGIVAREFTPGRTTAPEAAEPLAKNLNPAAITLQARSNNKFLIISVNGIQRLDVWVPPKLIDAKKKLEVRVNKKTYFKGLPKPSLEPYLEDLRLRGDRQQIYWMKVPVG